ncbi:MAG: hypothetical protein U0P82_20470, partial [Vicinamibacterales bacterium]
AVVVKLLRMVCLLCPSPDDRTRPELVARLTSSAGQAEVKCQVVVSQHNAQKERDSGHGVYVARRRAMYG